MKDLNTKKRKKMIKEMKKNMPSYKFSGDTLVNMGDLFGKPKMKKKVPSLKYNDESNAQKLIHPSCPAEDIMQFKEDGVVSADSKGTITRERAFPIAWKVNESDIGFYAKPGGVSKTFTALEVCNLLAESLGVKPSENRELNVSWKIMPMAKDNTITITEIVRKADRNPEFRKAMIKVGLHRVIHTALITAVFILLAILILK